jgi:beta-phosphoglucomutase-like phosphatase (HAD superfamily)
MSHHSLRAIIFDFNGVIADDEITHFLAFQQALAEEGLALTKEEYYGTGKGVWHRFLPMLSENGARPRFSYPAHELTAANLVLPNLQEMSLENLESCLK